MDINKMYFTFFRAFIMPNLIIYIYIYIYVDMYLQPGDDVMIPICCDFLKTHCYDQIFEKTT
jgi:hypothetical protein